MFTKANLIARQFTKPVILSRKMIAGPCSAHIGAYIVVNKDGWILTAGHILEKLAELNQGAEAARHAESERAGIEADTNLTPKQRRRALGKTQLKPSDTDYCSAWWGFDRVQIRDAVVIPSTIVDLALGRLEPFDPSWVNHYPVFKDPAKNFEPGRSLCKLGFPFHSVTPTWDSTTKQFTLPPPMPPPFFPIDGIFTRTAEIIVQGAPPPPFPLRWVETSTPGLRGQSGGPTFDADGTVWAIQCQTKPLSLGFDPKVPGGKSHQTEHQFLNVGLGVHPDTIFGLLREHAVSFKISTD